MSQFGVDMDVPGGGRPCVVGVDVVVVSAGVEVGNVANDDIVDGGDCAIEGGVGIDLGAGGVVVFGGTLQNMLDVGVARLLGDRVCRGH